MANESGDMKPLDNFSKLIKLVSVNADYNPANTALRVSSLSPQKTADDSTVADVGTQQAAFGPGRELFKSIKGLEFTRSR